MPGPSRSAVSGPALVISWAKVDPHLLGLKVELVGQVQQRSGSDEDGLNVSDTLSCCTRSRARLSRYNGPVRHPHRLDSQKPSR